MACSHFCPCGEKAKAIKGSRATGGRQARHAAKLWRYAYEMNIDDLFSHISAREESYGWEGLSDAERTVATVILLWYEVGNGGFKQYFFNSTGDLALKAPDAFLKIGAPRTAEEIEQANNLFGIEGPSSDRQKRKNQLREITETCIAMWGELDKFIIDDTEDLEELLSEYAIHNGLQE